MTIVHYCSHIELWRRDSLNLVNPVLYGRYGLVVVDECWWQLLGSMSWFVCDIFTSYSTICVNVSVYLFIDAGFPRKCTYGYFYVRYGTLLYTLIKYHTKYPMYPHHSKSRASSLCVPDVDRIIIQGDTLG